jgi:poly(3-hydroxybutyrate) depolymerase
MKRQFSLFLHLFLLLTLSACGLTKASPSPTPSPTATIQPSQLPSCPSGEAAAPEVVETWSPPPEAEGITPLSCNEIGAVFTYDPQAPLDVQEVSRHQEEGVTVIDLTYASPMGGQVPATLVVPDGAGPFAGMLYEHGMPSTRQQMIPAGVAYARMGAVVLLIDAPYVRRPNGAQIDMTERARREQIQFIVDLRRGIDLLLSRPEVDPERLGYVGLSYGALMGGLLAGVEDRLEAYVLQGGDGGLVSHLNNRNYRTEWLSRPEEERRQWVAWMWPIEPIHYVGCASPAALLFQNGTLDTSSTPADALRYYEAGSAPKTIRWYQAGHSLNTAALQDQVEWLAEMIGISAGPLAMPVDPQVLAAYAGRYQVSDGPIVTIRVDGTRIFLQIPNEPGYEQFAGEYELLASSKDHFYVWASTDITFGRNASGEVDRLVCVLSGVTYEAKKVP